MKPSNKKSVFVLLATLTCLLTACGASSGGGAASEAVSGVSTPSQVSVVTAR